MKKENFDDQKNLNFAKRNLNFFGGRGIKSELFYLLILFAISLIIFKIAFYKEGLWIIFRTVISLFWLFAIPGYCIMLYWHNKLSFSERIVAGFFVSAAITGILSYYIGLIGLNVKFHFILLPLVLIIFGLIYALKKSTSS